MRERWTGALVWSLCQITEVSARMRTRTRAGGFEGGAVVLPVGDEGLPRPAGGQGGVGGGDAQEGLAQHLGRSDLRRPVRGADRLVREVVRRPSRPVAALVAVRYAAYILHPYIVISLQSLIEGFALPAFAKFALVAVLGIVLAFGLAWPSCRVPGLRVIGTTPE